MSTAHVLLGVLAAQGVSHGYELKHEHDRRLLGVRPLAFGQLYTTLARMLRDGYIVEAAHQRVGGPDRVAYRLTPEGMTALDGWLSRAVPPAVHVSGELFVKVIVALLATPDEVTARSYLAAQRAAHLARMRELTAVKTGGSASVTELAAADYLLNHLDADLRWMATTLDRIGQLRSEVRS
ncbi:PadR family transcriptional regulator [Micromonospora gifhornensis]|uniref:PadR family transcriptional regulator n=1 Tax=Micromonospora gifhornensis TaxID=84594 RepID=A0ABQ4ICD1_9ACTN|nr:helix-turn-helix transcriptional regulator [Micromonospora gifhornensis]GIJ15423.1 PadR family transcriptional regulator [Micromonospora gifhornensis]